MFEEYLIHLLIFVAINLILVVSLNLALGYTGLLNFGHVAFFGIGAYTSALLVEAGYPFAISFIIAGVVAGFFGFLLIFGTKKLKGDYLALATLGFSFVVYSLMLNMDWLTNGALGISGIDKPSFFGITVSSNLFFLFFIVVITLVVLLIIKRIIDSSFGKLLQATRDDEIGLRVLGKNTFKLKIKSMVISAFFAGLAGSLYAHYLGYIDPSAFYLSKIILLVTIVIIGGLASLRGSIVATFLIILLPELLRFFALPSSIMGPLRQIIYALVLILILMFRPRGLFGRVDLE